MCARVDCACQEHVQKSGGYSKLVCHKHDIHKLGEVLDDQHHILMTKGACGSRTSVSSPCARAHTHTRMQLSASAISYKFPEPGYLEGVKTKDKAILKMQKVRSHARMCTG